MRMVNDKNGGIEILIQREREREDGNYYNSHRKHHKHKEGVLWE